MRDGVLDGAGRAAQTARTCHHSQRSRVYSPPGAFRQDLCLTLSLCDARDRRDCALNLCRGQGLLLLLLCCCSSEFLAAETCLLLPADRVCGMRRGNPAQRHAAKKGACACVLRIGRSKGRSRAGHQEEKCPRGTLRRATTTRCHEADKARAHKHKENPATEITEGLQVLGLQLAV